MVVKEYAAKARRELMKRRNSTSAMAPKIMQQKKPEVEPKSQTDAKKAGAKKGTSKKDADVKKDSGEQELKTWEVASHQLKELKVAATVKLSSETTRKFLFKEWNDRNTARKVAEEFARQALTVTNQCDCLKLKKDKAARIMGLHALGRKPWQSSPQNSWRQAWLIWIAYSISHRCGIPAPMLVCDMAIIADVPAFDSCI